MNRMDLLPVQVNEEKRDCAQTEMGDKVLSGADERKIQENKRKAKRGAL